jgi:hypothetical protein
MKRGMAKAIPLSFARSRRGEILPGHSLQDRQRLLAGAPLGGF